MKILNYSILALLILGFMASCEKQDSVTVTDNTVTFNPEVENVNILAISSYSVVTGEATLRHIYDEDGILTNYSLELSSPEVGVDDPIFLMAFEMLSEDEAAITENDYPGLFAATVSQEGLDFVAGCDPEGSGECDFSPYLTGYDAEGLQITISNLDGESAEILVVGSMTDFDSGESFTVDGIFNAAVVY